MLAVRGKPGVGFRCFGDSMSCGTEGSDSGLRAVADSCWWNA